MENNVREIKKRIEAILFMCTEPIHLRTLTKNVGIGSYSDVKMCIEELMKEYTEKDSAIEIVHENDNYFMKVRDEYLGVVASISRNTELSKGELKTLAYIAKKEGNTGVLQSAVVKTIGQNAYQYIQKLLEQKFINARPSKKSKLLSTTAKFREYFKVENI